MGKRCWMASLAGSLEAFLHPILFALVCCCLAFNPFDVFGHGAGIKN